MKKLLSILLFSFTLTFSFAAPKTSTPKGTKLSAKNKFAIEGIELGTLSWSKATVTNKGEILWNDTTEWQETGWDLRGVDMSQYGAIRIELAPDKNDELKILLENPVSLGNWGFDFENNVAFVYFDGTGRIWGDMINPDPEEGFLIKIGGEFLKTKKTVIKKVELYTKESISGFSNKENFTASHNKNLSLRDIALGTTQSNSLISEDGTIEWIWNGKEKNPWIGWDVRNLDLSDIDRIRIEVESTDVNIDLKFEQSGCHIGFRPISTELLVAKFDGNGNYWTWPEGAKWDVSKGIERIEIRVNSSKFTQNGYKSKIKSVELVPKTYGKMPDDFVKIKSGTFLMGSNISNYTKPVHEVKISYDYYMCDHEVTKEEYKTIMGAGYPELIEENTYYCSDPYSITDLLENAFPGEIQYKRPADNVSWFNAIIYCNKRSVSEGLTPCYSMVIDGKDVSDVEHWGEYSKENCKLWNTIKCNFCSNGYRLPTEAEWEYAARAGDDTVDAIVWSGTNKESEVDKYAWPDFYGYKYTNESHEVKKKLPNVWGLYDMTGNVNEWCWDWYPYKDGAFSFEQAYDSDANGVIDPTHGASLKSDKNGEGGEGRVIRGFYYITYRWHGSPNSHTSFAMGGHGFRVVRSDPNINKKRRTSLISGKQLDSPTEGEGVYTPRVGYKGDK